MTTLLEVVDEANELMLGGMREQITQLNGAVNSSAGTVTLDDGLEGISRGDLIEIDTELMYVLSWNDGTNVATVLRGYNSDAATHADNSVAVINPIVPKAMWRKHINNVLRSLSSPVAGLFRVQPVEVTFNSSAVAYNLAGVEDMESVISVQASQPGSIGDWVDVNRRDYAIQRDMATGDFASSFALRLTGSQPYSGRRIRVLYRAPFGLLDQFEEIVESVSGVPATAVDLLALGAVVRACEGNEIARNKLETNPIRKLGDVPPGAINSSLAGIRNQFQVRKQEEAMRLVRRYGL